MAFVYTLKVGKMNKLEFTALLLIGIGGILTIEYYIRITFQFPSLFVHIKK